MEVQYWGNLKVARLEVTPAIHVTCLYVAYVYFKPNSYVKTTVMGPGSIAGVLFDSVRRFRATSYCTPLVCVSAVLELLTVWRHYKPKTNNV